VHEIRIAARELGRRMVEAGVFDSIENFGMLRDDELDAFVADPPAWRTTIREREDLYAKLQSLEPPFVVVGEPPPIDTWQPRSTTPTPEACGTVLQGIPGCPGEATGRARVVLDSSNPTALEPGDVLVAPITDPSWTPLFVPAGAVVVDVGAQLSHAVIVSRELGIPCVVSVTGATRRIADGARVKVSGTDGTVEILE
jgi:phosphohistidine swiveling domain-containing protein